jgi:hypothetical protein
MDIRNLEQLQTYWLNRASCTSRTDPIEFEIVPIVQSGQDLQYVHTKYYTNICLHHEPRDIRDQVSFCMRTILERAQLDGVIGVLVMATCPIRQNNGIMFRENFC